MGLKVTIIPNTATIMNWTKSYNNYTAYFASWWISQQKLGWRTQGSVYFKLLKPFAKTQLKLWDQLSCPSFFTVCALWLSWGDAFDQPSLKFWRQLTIFHRGKANTKKTSHNIFNQQLLTYNLTEIKEEIFTYNLQTTIRVKLANVTCVKPTLAISIDFKGFSCFLWVFVITQSHTGASNDNLSSGMWFVVLGVISYWKTRGGIMVV